MLLDQFQEAAKKTAIYPEQGMIGGLGYTILGLVGEAGELANKFKKVLRDGDDTLKVHEMVSELSDVLWYVAMIADELGVSLDYVAYRNLEKLEDRQKRGVIGGSGDER